MTPNELLQYYESLVGDPNPKPNEENCHLRAYISEIRDLWEKTSDFAGVAITCWNAGVQRRSGLR